MQVKVVYEKQEHFADNYGPYGQTKVGLKIGNRVVWLAATSGPEDINVFLKYENIAKEIANRCSEKWDQFQCEQCSTKFAIEAKEGEIIDEPICPVCTSDNVRDAE